MTFSQFARLTILALLLAGCAALQADPPSSTASSAPTVEASLPGAAGRAAAGSPTPSVSPSSTPTHTPTIPRAAPTRAPSATSSATAAASPLPSRSPTATLRPTITRTPTQTPGIPIAAVQILDPGPLSKIIAPLEVNASVRVGSSKAIYIALYGEDGRLLASQLLTYAVEANQRVPVQVTLDFAISAVAEAGRLQISTKDTYGRMVALGSTELLLLSMGENEFNPALDPLEAMVVQQPVANTLIQGGQLTVAGMIRPLGNGLILGQLITADGRVVGVAQSVVAIPSAGGYTPFQFDIPYTVSQLTWVRLVVEEGGGRIPGAAQLTSLEVLLSP